MARIVDARCVLAVRNLTESTRYYTDVLGFEREAVAADGWSFLARDTFKLMLGECPAEKPAGELGDHSYFVYLYIDGIEAFYDEVCARGATLISPLEDKPWGLREFALRTPDGHRITCGQPIVTR